MKTDRVLFIEGKKTYTTEDIARALRKVSVTFGDTLFVHSDVQSFGKLPRGISRETFLQGFIDALFLAVGKNGNIIMPTFSYSFCKGEVFDVNNTPSTVGVLTEYFRAQAKVLRSNDAIFSVSAKGKDAEFFTTVGNDCFGENSIFEKLYRRNATMLFLGETFDITFMHFVEQTLEVPYRYKKQFSGTIIEIDETTHNETFDYNVRSLDGSVYYDLDKVAQSLSRRGLVRETQLGNSTVRAIYAKDAYSGIHEGLQKDLHFLRSKSQ